MTSKLHKLRRMIWHLRRKGISGVRNWRLRERAESKSAPPENVKGAEGGWIGFWNSRRLSFMPAVADQRKPRRTDIRAAVILDEFSHLAFKYEWSILALERESWKSQLTAYPVDFLFVESAWNGNKGSWQYQLTGQRGPKPEFMELVAWCRENSIPTIFWNKEDPPHYEDFLPAARLFDLVFTSDASKLEAYRHDLGHDRVDVLSFAAQPAIHNPIRPRHGWHARDVAFAGMYFAHKYPERRDQMDWLLGGAATASEKMALGLEIFSRQLDGDKNYQFPNPLSNRVVGSLTYAQMLTAYKAYKVFLNVNSVVDSPSMCARRIFEITASGTPVLTTPSQAIHGFFTNSEVTVALDRADSADLSMALVKNNELNDRVVHLGQRRIWSENTYAHRAEKILAAVLPEQASPVRRQTVSALVSTFRPNQLDHVFKTLGSQKDVDTELVLLTHGFEVKSQDLLRLKAKYGVDNVQFLSAERDIPLGACLNLCADAASGEVFTKMDDDDYYGPNYLGDQLHALAYSNAEIVGKQAHYMYVASKNATILRNAFKEHRFTRLVMGPTIMGSQDVFRQTPFRRLSTGEDTTFLEDVAQNGGYIYSADRFNFCQYRTSSNHTWSISDNYLLASGEIKFFGGSEEHITL